MQLNLLVRGQSNSHYMMENDNNAGRAALVREVERLLGFDGTTDRINLVYDRDWNSGTSFGGTALIGDWLTPRNGDWRQGWNVAGREQALLNEIGSLPAGQKDDPTAVLWLHNEFDSGRAGLSVEEWVSAVRFDAAQTRGALAGQGAATTPYLFISAMPYPYYGASDAGHNVIRQGMEQLAADASFNASIAARMLDTDVDADWAGAYGGGHIDGQDAMQTVLRSARAVAEEFAPYAKAGSPVALGGGDIADDGPQVIRATTVGTSQLRIDVRHDKAGGFQALDADAARGVGWSVVGPGGTVWGTAAVIEDGDTLLVTFSGALPAGGKLHYGWGYGRLAGADGSGRGNAVYDNQGLPIWVAAVGLTPEGVAAAPPPPPPAPPANLVVNGTAGDDNLRGGAGADTLTGGAGSDDLQGLDGNDVLIGGRGHDGLTLGAGADRVIYARGDGDDWVVDFAPGTDSLLVQGYAAGEATIRAATYWGFAGTDIVLAGGDRIFLQGVTAFRAADVTWEGGAAPAPTPVAPPPSPTAGLTVNGTGGDDNLRGGAGADTLAGGAGSDDLQGLDGNDVLRGGRDHDGMTGGAGIDTFVMARGDGSDWIVDFQAGTEKLRLEGIGAGSVTQTVTSFWGLPGVLVRLGGGDEVFLEGVRAPLAAGDIVFA